MISFLPVLNPAGFKDLGKISTLELKSPISAQVMPGVKRTFKSELSVEIEKIKNDGIISKRAKIIE